MSLTVAGLSMAGLPALALAQAKHAEKRRDARRVQFALFADNPSRNAAEQQVRQALQRASGDAEFFIHVGDIKGGGESCDDGLLSRRIALLQQAPRPVFFTPGDNDWTDCHRLVAGSFDPLERLQWLRSIAFERQQSLGSSPVALQSQTEGRLLASPLTVYTTAVFLPSEPKVWISDTIDCQSLWPNGV